MLRSLSIESSSVEPQVVFVESAEQDGAEVERPDAVVDLFQADVQLDDARADVTPKFPIASGCDPMAFLGVG